MSIIQMTAADIPDVLNIDNDAFVKPWQEKDFADELAKDYSKYFIYIKDGRAVGYAGIWCIYETAELIRIAAASDCCRRGIGGALMAELLRVAAEQGCERMLLEVRSSNKAAREMYKKYGFCEISVRRGYYDDEDAVIMERVI